MIHRRHIQLALGREVADWRRWWSRIVVVAIASLAGLTIVGFTWLSERALGAFFAVQQRAWWAPLLWTPACTALIVWLTRRFVPGIAGSGIPQVMVALDTRVGGEERGLFVSLRLALAKIGLTSASLLAGLSAGREGPSVQIAAGIMLQARRLVPLRSTVTAHGLLVAGGAAGIAAAFNTPLAGVMFAIEELSRTPEQRSSGLIVAAIVIAGLMAVSIHGNATYFGVIHAPGIGLSLLLPGLLVTVLAGVAGGVFSRLVITSLGGQGKDWMSCLRRKRPVAFAAVCGFLVAVIGVVSAGATFGSGYSSTQRMLEGSGSMPAAYLLFKFLATWLTTWSGAPAGMFAPALAVGAALGNNVAMLTGHAQVPALIALGMVGFLAATTQAPLTAFIIVMEMVDGHEMVLSLMACALVASALARVVGPALYPTLAQQQFGRLPHRDEAKPAVGP
jgi:H+/Cl- antiporter ClcA